MLNYLETYLLVGQIQTSQTVIVIILCLVEKQWDESLIQI